MLWNERRENLFEERRESELVSSGLCCCWELYGRAWVSIIVVGFDVWVLGL